MKKSFKPRRELTDCRVAGCERRMVVGYLMCGRCWESLSLATQRAVRQAEGAERSTIYHGALREAASKVDVMSGPRTLADVLGMEGSVA